MAIKRRKFLGIGLSGFRGRLADALLKLLAMW
jgi:hypothetical protein